MIGPGLNFPQDAIYPFSQKDADGKDYVGSEHEYVMRFEPGPVPPVNGFWSLTMYNPDFFFVPNAIDRYSPSQRDTFVTNTDGSADLVFPGGIAGPGQGGELAARPQREVHPDAPPLLA